MKFGLPSLSDWFDPTAQTEQAGTQPSKATQASGKTTAAATDSHETAAKPGVFGDKNTPNLGEAMTAPQPTNGIRAKDSSVPRSVPPNVAGENAILSGASASPQGLKVERKPDVILESDNIIERGLVGSELTRSLTTPGLYKFSLLVGGQKVDYSITVRPAPRVENDQDGLIKLATTVGGMILAARALTDAKKTKFTSLKCHEMGGGEPHVTLNGEVCRKEEAINAKIANLLHNLNSTKTYGLTEIDAEARPVSSERWSRGDASTSNTQSHTSGSAAAETAKETNAQATARANEGASTSLRKKRGYKQPNCEAPGLRS